MQNIVTAGLTTGIQYTGTVESIANDWAVWTSRRRGTTDDFANIFGFSAPFASPVVNTPIPVTNPATKRKTRGTHAL